ncbi:hypothetical protein [Novilysobacter spongiicola]|uniref:Sulfotransferase family protein n=1 Tax=Lysobacter spongiicola DSM 21749 TaxID=1122188 RepID=A0A1T4PFD6_9GAMM|nr:hypothetical protein [Lysobacter spongiicola]SJZ90270.1 hypothetical protein SAMN02745674_01170 [Lysobacter spongiicola DSM 21749]
MTHPLAGSADGPRLALTGVPRGGTTLACRILDQCADTVALFEPMPVNELPAADPTAAVAAVSQFFESTRRQLLDDGTAVGKHRGGALPDNPFSSERNSAGRRRLQVSRGVIEIGRPASRFTLVVKHNAAFTALLPELAAALPTLAVVRNPLSVLASWNSVDLPVGRGRLPAGERLCPALARVLGATPDLLERQLEILGWFFGRFREALPPERVLRYEDIVASQGALLRERAGLVGSYDQPLSERNASADYVGADVERFASALVGRAECWRPWYGEEDVVGLVERLRVLSGAGGGMGRGRG